MKTTNVKLQTNLTQVLKRYGLLCLLLLCWRSISLASPPPDVFNVLAFGADARGTVLSTGAIQRAIDAAHDAGGGTVFLPAGTFLTGTLFPKSNIQLLFGPGAVLQGSADSSAYRAGYPTLLVYSRSTGLKADHDQPPYPYPIWSYCRTPHNNYIRYARNLSLQNVTFTWGEVEQPAWGSALRLTDVSGIKIGGFEGRQARGSDQAAITLQDAQHMFIYHAYAPERTEAFLNIVGNSHDVRLTDNDLHQARRLLHGQSKPIDSLSNP